VPKRASHLAASRAMVSPSDADLRDESPAGLKAAGNEEFQRGNFQSALDIYSRALESGSDLPADPALFRRALAYEATDKLADAYKDASQLFKQDPGNKAVQPLLARLQKRREEVGTTEAKTRSMLSLICSDEIETDEEKRVQCLNNMTALCRQPACRLALWDSPRACNRLLVLSESDTISRSLLMLLKSLVWEMAGIGEYRKRRSKAEEDRRKSLAMGMVAKPLPQLLLSDEIAQRIDALLRELLQASHSNRLQAFTRDFRAGAAAWYKQFLDCGGIETILNVTCAFHKGSHEHLRVTEDTRRHASLLLARVYDDLTSDQMRQTFREAACTFVMDLLTDKFFDSKIEALNALGALLEGRTRLRSLLLAARAFWRSGIELHQRLALETLVLAISKKAKADSVLRSAMPVLQQLYTSGKDSIKVRALVGLCKLGTASGSDSSCRGLADGSNVVLAKSCRRFLANPDKDLDLRRWAALSDLALRSRDPAIVYPCAAVLVNLTNSYDKQDIMPEMVELAKFAKHHVPKEHEKDGHAWVEGRINRLVKAGMLPALVQLASVSDKAMQVTNTCRELLSRVFLATLTMPEHRGPAVAAGAAKALLSLANSRNTDGGQVLAAQALARLAVSLNPETAFPGQRAAELVRPLNQLLHAEANSLQVYEALLALTNLASAGDSLRSRLLSEIGLGRIPPYSRHRVPVQPLPAGQGRRFHSCRRRCRHLRGRQTDAAVLRSAARRDESTAEAADDKKEKLAPINEGGDGEDKLEPLVKPEDNEATTAAPAAPEEPPETPADRERLVMAASGALAQLTTRVEVVGRMLSYPVWPDSMSYLASHPNPLIAHRGLYILRNACACTDSELAARVAASPLLEVLMAVSRLDNEPAFKAARDLAKEALDCLAKAGFIRSVAP
uniref:TPR_REGION domain-containing protein n=1 Tax=Macrostomum lignano TaxID=282301 RepID=A0A1I8H1Z3_9PLAT